MSGALDAARREAAGRAAELESRAPRRGDRAAALGAANAAAAAAGARLDEVRAAWDRRREELESALAGVQAELAAAEERLRVEAVARTTLEDELDRERAARAALAEVEQQAGAARAERDAERTAAGHLRIELQSARASLDDVERQAAAARAERDTERTAAADLRRELEVARAERDAEREAAADLRSRLEAAQAELDAAPGTLADLRAELETERAARLAAEQALAAARQTPPAPGPEQLERLAREQTAAAAAYQPAPLPGRHGRRPRRGRRGAAAPAAAPSRARARAGRARTPSRRSSGASASDEGEREPVVPGVEPPRPPGEQADEPAWAPPGFEPPADDEAAEPPAPDAEPLVESAPPPDAPAPFARPEPIEPPTAPPASVLAPTAPSLAPPVASPQRTAGPVVVPASRPPARGLMVGSDRRDYPLLRGAIVKLAHDDPALAGRLLAALLPAQGAAIDGPLGYDLTIAGTGTFSVAIAGGRAFVEPLERPRPRGDAEFHLQRRSAPAGRAAGGRRAPDRALLRAGPRARAQAAPEGAAGAPGRDPHAGRGGARGSEARSRARVPHVRVRRASLVDARARLHDRPGDHRRSGRDVVPDRPRRRGVTVSTTGAEPDATVTMSRAAFDRLLRAETVPNGDRPMVRGDRDAVALMLSWTQRAQGAEPGKVRARTRRCGRGLRRASRCSSSAATARGAAPAAKTSIRCWWSATSAGRSSVARSATDSTSRSSISPPWAARVSRREPAAATIARWNAMSASTSAR